MRMYRLASLSALEIYAHRRDFDGVSLIVNALRERGADLHPRYGFTPLFVGRGYVAISHVTYCERPAPKVWSYGSIVGRVVGALLPWLCGI
jgi:hypothetical protein